MGFRAPEKQIFAVVTFRAVGLKFHNHARRLIKQNEAENVMWKTLYKTESQLCYGKTKCS